MCKIGDIIAVPGFIGDGNNFVNIHYFVVVNDRNGKIEGLSFNIVGTVMSSFKSIVHKNKKIKYLDTKGILKQNIEI